MANAINALPEQRQPCAGTRVHARAGLRPEERDDGHQILVGHALVLHQRHRDVAVGPHAVAQDARKLAVGAAPDAGLRVGSDVGGVDVAERQREHVGAGQRQHLAASQLLPSLLGPRGSRRRRPARTPGTGRARATPGRSKRRPAGRARRTCAPSPIYGRRTRRRPAGPRLAHASRTNGKARFSVGTGAAVYLLKLRSRRPDRLQSSVVGGRMSPRRLAALAIMIPTLAAAQGPGPLKYPDARRADTVETLHGRAVPDPYRWLEDPNSDETKAWIAAENRVTFGYLEQIPARAKIKERLTQPLELRALRHAVARGRLVHLREKRRPAEPVGHLQDAGRSTRRPRSSSTPTRSRTTAPWPSAASRSATTASTWRIRCRRADRTGSSGTCATSRRARDLPDVLKWGKFSSAAWLKDGSGFFYSRYDAPKEGETFTGVNKFQKVFFHKLGTVPGRRHAGLRAQGPARLGPERPTSPTTGGFC